MAGPLARSELRKDKTTEIADSCVANMLIIRPTFFRHAVQQMIVVNVGALW